MLNALETARAAAEGADGKKAFDIIILDLAGLTTIADYFVICSGNNSTQVGAIADGVGHSLASVGRIPDHVEGEGEASWILMDYGDVVVHIFDEQTRAYYGLEKLWGDAKKVLPSIKPHALQSTSS